MVLSNVTDNNETYLGLYIKCPIFCLLLTKSEISQQIFIKVPNTKFHRNPPFGRQTDIMEVPGALRDYTNMPTNCSLSIVMHLSNYPHTKIQEQQNKFTSNLTYTKACH